MINYIEFYEDELKVTLIISSLCQMETSGSRADDHRGESYRLIDGTLEAWSDWSKMEEEITLQEVSLEDRNILKALYESHDFFYYVPDPANAPATIFKVYWDGNYNEEFNKKDNVYSIPVILKEA